MSGCASAIPPPALPSIASIGCLEIEVTQVSVGRRPVLEWRLTNVCDHAVPVDLAQARVVAIGPAFARMILAPRDPYQVFAPGWLDIGESAFVRMRRLYEDLARTHPGIDTLSMGMSEDFEAAIAQGATLVRIGSALFGPRS